jgi:hypothetical protein
LAKELNYALPRPRDAVSSQENNFGDQIMITISRNAAAKLSHEHIAALLEGGEAFYIEWQGAARRFTPQYAIS